MSRRVLLIAYHFPPVLGSSGVLRTLNFARQLPGYGWEPVVLTANARAYPQTSAHHLADIPDGTPIGRGFALDSARHLAINGTYPGFLAVPDRWWTWWVGGVPTGLRMIRRWHPDILWSTAPIATAHWIGLTLHRLTGLPWVADIRDLLTEPNEPAHPLAWRTTRWIERRTLLGSSRTVVVSPGQKNEYLNQFPNLQPSHLRVVPNGYDEEAFADAERTLAPARDQNRLLLIHGGVLYPDGRNPEAFFQALARLIGDGRIGSEELEVRLRASGSEDLYEPRIRKLGLESIVRLLPGLDYREGLAEMMSADGLLLFQGAGTGTAIPAKLYEYFRAQRPILALTEPGGATAAELEKAGFDRMAPLEDPDLILSVMESWIQDLRHGKGHTLSLQEAQGYSRQEGTAQLARIFEEISG